MTTIDKINSRIFSRLGQSGAIFGMSLMEQVKEHPIKVVSADMSIVSGLDRFKKLYPNDFYNVGIAEQNMIGVAAGLSSEHYKSVSVAQACFISMRSFEQIRQYLGYMRNNVVCVGINSGLSLTFFGNTHYAIEDVSLMSSIHNMIVISPADAGEAVKAFEASLRVDVPVYLRLSGGLNCPVVYKDDFDFTIGRANVLNEGDDITIFATGTMVKAALRALEFMQDLSVKVVDVHTLKPFDRDVVERSINSRLLVSLEEHNVFGGLGSAVADVLSEIGRTPPLLKLGIKGYFDLIGNYDYLLRQSRLTPELIAEDILERYRKL